VTFHSLNLTRLIIYRLLPSLISQLFSTRPSLDASPRPQRPPHPRSQLPRRSPRKSHPQRRPLPRRRNLPLLRRFGFLLAVYNLALWHGINREGVKSRVIVFTDLECLLYDLEWGWEGSASSKSCTLGAGWMRLRELHTG